MLCSLAYTQKYEVRAYNDTLVYPKLPIAKKCGKFFHQIEDDKKAEIFSQRNEYSSIKSIVSNAHDRFD